MSELSRLLGLGDIGDELEGDELLEWDDEDEGGMSPSVLLVAGAAIALIVAALVIRRRGVAARERLAPAPVSPVKAGALRSLELGPGQRSHLGIVFDEAELDATERAE